MKYTHGDQLQFTAEFVQGDLIKFKAQHNKEWKNHYSKVILVKTYLNDKGVIQQSFVTENGFNVPRENVLTLEKRGPF